MVRNLQYEKMKSIGKNLSQRASSSGKQALNKCSASEGVDNFVLIDVDSDFPNVIIIDVPESLQKKLRKPSPRMVISIDDDEATGGVCSNDNDSASSSRCSSKPTSNSAKANGKHYSFVNERNSAVNLSKCQRTYSGKAGSRKHYGLGLESDSGSTESDCSDCECMDGPAEKLREQWEMASQRRKSAFHTGVSRSKQASTSTSRPDLHFDPCVENAAKQSYFPDQSSPIRMESDKRKSFPSAEHAFRNSLNNDDDKHDPFDAFARADKAPYFPNIRDAMKRGSSSMENNSSRDAEKHRYVDVNFGFSSFCGNECGAQEPAMAATEWGDSLNHPLQDLETKITSEPCSYNRQPRFDEQFDCDVSEPLDEDPCVLKSQLSGDADSECDRAASMDVNEELPDPGVCSTHFNRKATANGEGNSRNSRPGLASFQNFDSCNKVDMEEKNTAHCQEPGIISLQNHQKAETGYRFYHSVQNEANESTCEMMNGPTVHKTKDVLQDLGGKTCQNDIITDRQKIKETDEYKRAMEEEWASRQRQLQIQAEEAQRLRRRKRAESLRIMDMERRQKQRLEEMRETQKKDEENLNMKEQFRVEIRKELNQVERSCRDMASLLRCLGLHVDGGLFPSQNEVQAAYKKALLKFHPDRASRTDIHQQVEAEEKFKLISRMKEKFCLAG